jgi:predicted PurR-regulated permease PerM
MLGLDQRAARYTWTAALVLLLLYVAYLIRDTLFLFVVALMFAYLLYPLVHLLDRFIPSRTRGLALAVVYIALIGVIVLLGVELGSQAAEQAAALSQRAPEILEKMRHQPPTGALPSHVQTLQQTMITTVEGYIYKHYGEFVSVIPKVSLEILKASTDLIYLVIVPILSFFLLKDGLVMRDELVSFVDPGPSRQLMEEILADVHTLLLQYMRALFTLCSITLVTFAIVLSLLGVPYSILLASVAFPLEFIPLVGPLIAAVAIIGVTLASGYPVLWVIVFLGIYRLCQDYIISPRLMSAGVELHPLLVILGVFAGAELAGIRGTFLSVPTLALLRVVYRRIRMWRLSSRELALVK